MRSKTPDILGGSRLGALANRPWFGRRALAMTACVAATGAGVLALGGSATAARGSVSCSTERGVTITATTSVRIYRRGASDDATYYGCWLKTHRRTKLAVALNVGENDATATFSPVVGRYVAISAFSTSDNVSSASASVVDLKAGKVLRKASAVVDQDDPDSALTSAVATTDGSLVWAGQSTDCGGVHAVTASGARTLACGTVSDLVASGSRVYWLLGGQAQTAIPSKP